MKFSDLDISSKKNRKRSGRGIAAGRGKTAGRGTKGQNARSGGQRRPGFEGGQNPLYMRLPKLRGFNSHIKGAQQVTTEQLARVKGANVTHQSLKEAGLIDSEYRAVKVILKGEVSKKFNVKVDKITDGAESVIKKAGGSFTETASPSREKKNK